MKRKPKILLFIAVLFANLPVFAQSITGLWKTIDDRNGETKAIIRIYEENGLLYGTVEEILVAGKEDALCTACSGPRENKPIEGMQIINGLKKTGPLSWKGDAESLFDPEQGRYFRSKIWLDSSSPDDLKVRGYWMFIYRTQTWKRMNKPM